MKVVESIDELKIGDKLVFLDTPFNDSFIEYCANRYIPYVVVKRILDGTKTISVDFINYKGMVSIASYSVKVLRLGRSRFAYYEGS